MTNIDKIIKTKNRLLNVLIEADLGQYEALAVIQNVTIPIIKAYKASTEEPLAQVLDNYMKDLRDGIEYRKVANDDRQDSE